VVNREASFIARFGITDPMQQLVALTAITIAIWVLESLFEYLLTPHPLQPILVT
jgi:ATP-binding cassette subfamily B protein